MADFVLKNIFFWIHQQVKTTKVRNSCWHNICTSLCFHHHGWTRDNELHRKKPLRGTFQHLEGIKARTIHLQSNSTWYTRNQRWSSQKHSEAPKQQCSWIWSTTTWTLKHVWPELYELLAESPNNIFAKHEYINVGHGLLTALRKLGKPKGPTKSLDLVILLTVLWKAISKIVLSRIQPTVKEFFWHCHSAYYKGRSSSDFVWCHRFLAARVQKFQEEIMIAGIDMTFVFDTIKRIKLIENLESFLRGDEILNIRILLSNTTLDINSSSNTSHLFHANIHSSYILKKLHIISVIK